MPPRYGSPPQPQGSRLQEALRLIMMLRAMENQQPPQQQSQAQGQNRIADIAKQAKDAKSSYDTIKDLFGLGSSSGASQAASSLGSAGGMSTLGGASSAATPGFTSVGQMVGNGLYTQAPGSMMMSSAAPAQVPAASSALMNPYAAAVAAVIANGYQLNRMSKKTKTETGMGALREAAKDPLTYVLPVASVGAALFGDKDMYLKEHRRLLGLKKKGINIPDQLIENTRLSQGRSKEDLVNRNYAQDYVGETSDGWVNNKFAQSRNEADLTKNDIVGYSAFSEKFGGDWWDKFSSKQREDIAQAVLDRKAVNEHHGTIDINWNPELDEIVGKIAAGETSQPQAPQQPALQRPGKGQVARVSPGMYMNDRGQIVRSVNSQGAMRSSYQIPRTGRR